MRDPTKFLLAVGRLVADMTDWIESIAGSGLLPPLVEQRARDLVAQSDALGRGKP